jgi:hypothetical protein
MNGNKRVAGSVDLHHQIAGREKDYGRDPRHSRRRLSKGEAPNRRLGDTSSALGSWLDESIRVRPYTTLAMTAIL